ETAAIEAIAGLVADCRCEIAATCLTFCSLDQHGCISLTSDNDWYDSSFARRLSSPDSEPFSCRHRIRRPQLPWQAARTRRLPNLRRPPPREGKCDGQSFPFPVL